MSDPISTVEKDVKAVYTFTKSHIVLTVSLAVALFFGVYTWDSKRADQADARAAVALVHAQDADQRANEATAANKQFQVDAAQKEAVADARVMQLQTEIDSLAKAMAARNVALAIQQKVDATMPPTQLAGHWQELVKVPNSVTVTSTGYAITPEAAVVTVQQLDAVPVLTKNIEGLTKTVADKDLQLAQKDNIIGLKTAENGSNVAVCNSNLAARDLDLKAKDATIGQLKADGRKKSLKYMIFGGFLVEALRIGLTHSL